MGANRLTGEEAGEALGRAIGANTVLKELDLSAQGAYDSQKCDATFAKGFSAGLGANGSLVKLSLRANMICGSEAGKALGDALAANTVLKELDLSRQGDRWGEGKLDAAFATEFAVGLGTNGVLEKLRFAENDTSGRAGGEVIAGILRRDTGLREFDVSGNCRGVKTGVPFATAVAGGLGANRALAKLSMGGNRFCAEGTMRLAAALKGNSVLTELDISLCNITYSYADKKLGTLAGVIAVSNTIRTMGALVAVNVSSNRFGAEGARTLANALSQNSVLTDLNVANNRMIWNGQGERDMSGVVAMRNAIPTMGAMVTANLMGNGIGKERLAALQELMKAHPTLVSLCGIANDATEADLFGLQMDADDAAILAHELPTKGALAKLDLRYNSIGYQWLQRIATCCTTQGIELEHECDDDEDDDDKDDDDSDDNGYGYGYGYGYGG